MTSVRWYYPGLAMMFLMSSVTRGQEPAAAAQPTGAKPMGAPVAKPSAGSKPAQGAAARATFAEGKLAGSIVARVDDRVVLLEEVMGPIRGKLEEAAKQMPREQYRQMEWEVLRQRTEGMVQRLVVLKELESRIPNPAAIDNVRRAINKDFEKNLLQTARQAGLRSKEELLAQLAKEGSSLEEQRKEFVDNILMQQYLGQLIRPEVKEPSREELVRYYQEHLKDFSTDKGVEWKHIQARYGNDTASAEEKIRSAMSYLQQGADFAEVAKNLSDGPTASLGGQWTLTSPGSYADDKVDAALFSIPIGSVSNVIAGDTAFHIVKVDKRSEGGAKPFAEVQEEIRKQISRERFNARRKAKMDEMMTRHHIETIFDSTSKEAGRETAPIR